MGTHQGQNGGGKSTAHTKTGPSGEGGKLLTLKPKKNGTEKTLLFLKKTNPACEKALDREDLCHPVPNPTAPRSVPLAAPAAPAEGRPLPQLLSARHPPVPPPCRTPRTTGGLPPPPGRGEDTFLSFSPQGRVPAGCPRPLTPRRARPPQPPACPGAVSAVPSPPRAALRQPVVALRPARLPYGEPAPSGSSARRSPVRGVGAGAAMVSAVGGPGPGGSRRRSRGPLAPGPAAPKPFPGPRSSARPWAGRGAGGPGALGRAGRALPRTGRGGAVGSCLGPGALRGSGAAGLGFPRPPQLGGSRLPRASPSPGPAAVGVPLRSLGAAWPKKWPCDRFSPSHAVLNV